MKKNVFRKGMVYAIVVLFIGVSIVPLTGIGAENHCLINDSIGYFNSIRESKERGVNVTLNGTMGENGWYISCVYIQISFGPDVCSFWYQFNGGHWKLYTEPFGPICEDGEYTFCWYYIDNEGNQSNVECIEFKIDQTDPTIDLTIEKIGFRKWLFTAIVSDETSGVNRVEFYFDQELQGTVTEPPYEWTYGPITPTGFSVKGVILNPEFTEETVSFFAVIVRGHVRWHYIYGHPTVNAIVYDYAGNHAISPPISPLFVINHLYIFQQLTFPNDYSGYIGEHFINAVFEDGPV